MQKTDSNPVIGMQGLRVIVTSSKPMQITSKGQVHRVTIGTSPIKKVAVVA